MAVATSPFGDVRVVMQKSDDALSYTVLFEARYAVVTPDDIARGICFINDGEN